MKAVSIDAAAPRLARRVLTFKEWCKANNFSAQTGYRILRSGTGPKVVQLSTRRIGIREDHNAAWQESRVR
jgi:predicted DNA-binding transcriptional regulator AlpA